MNLPKLIKIGPYDFTVELVPDLRDESGELHGQCCRDINVIRINSTTTNEQLRAETLWHEILHAIWGVFHLKTRAGEEKAVSTLATGTVMVLRDNPNLRKYLNEVFK